MLYMQESYVDTTPERVRVRGVDRRGAKPKEHSSDVLVVKIRKKLTNKNHQDMGESGINYTCQWAVRPHWRRYTKPLKNGSFVTRVPGYVKGPEGMPMKAKTRIFEVVQ